MRRKKKTIAAVHGTVTTFNPKQESWTNYTLRLVANEMRNAGKCNAILLSACAALVFKRIENVVGVDRLNANAYSEIV